MVPFYYRQSYLLCMQLITHPMTLFAINVVDAHRCYRRRATCRLFARYQRHSDVVQPVHLMSSFEEAEENEKGEEEGLDAEEVESGIFVHLSMDNLEILNILKIRL